MKAANFKNTNTAGFRAGLLQAGIFVTFVLLGWLQMVGPLPADIVTFNSGNASENESTRDAWLAAIGIEAPQYLVDFEVGFVDGQNIAGEPGLFPAGLVLRDTGSGDPAVVIRSGTGVINGSNPVGVFSATHDEQPYLELDFTENPVDYVAFQDIDQSGTSGVVSFVDGSSASFSFETTTTGGDSAEFFGIYRNDMPRITRVELDASGDGRWGVDTIEYGSSVLIGDVNLDGLVSLLDVQPFVNLLTNGGYQAEADINQDGVVSLLDVEPFVSLLTGD